MVDSLCVVLDRRLVDGARGWPAFGESSAGCVVEQEVAAEVVVFVGWEDLLSRVVLFEG